MGNDNKYFNFPVVLLNGFLDNSRECLDNICDYALYAYWRQSGANDVDLRATAKYFGIEVLDRNGFKILGAVKERGQQLYDSIPTDSPNASISLPIFWNYYKNDKTEFQKVVLLAFIAIRSILGHKPYCCISNNYWFSRMDGKSKSVEHIDELSPTLRSYCTRYKMDRIKSELVNNWKLVTYGYYTRGLYFSFKLNLETLITKVEQKRPTFLERDRRRKEVDVRDKIRDKLNPSTNTINKGSPK